jgi:hypothetical protein
VYSVLPDLAEARGEQAEWIGRPKFRNALTRELERLPFLPVRTSRGGSFVSPETGCVLPEPLRHFEEAELLPWALFGGDVASTRLLGDRARQCLDKLGLLREILPAELAGKWADGAVGKWQKKLGDRSQEALLRLLAALAKLDERQDWRAAPLCCLPSREGAWIHSAAWPQPNSDGVPDLVGYWFSTTIHP